MNTKFRILVIFSLVLSVVFSTTKIYANTPTTTPTTSVSEDKTTLRFIVYYSGDLSPVLNDKDSYMKTFMDVYNLTLISTFKIDETNSGFTLEAKEALDFPTEVAREISLITNVLMVEVTRVPTTRES
ncbi:MULTISPECIES: hypothetical protein [unclassified Aureispira]|uniref:hypothetical protein n=1 Tax=unclassified Aureispira TaxID=2649989 RepID=UPI0006973700|nr:MULTISPECIES: hypothetical protein [unclassified Aureispira]WMX15400.1 hypothetical protein QP953_03305 [Aureispira sp. CCB-E]